MALAGGLCPLSAAKVLRYLGRGQSGTVPLPAFLWMWEYEVDFCVVHGNEELVVPMPWVLGWCS